MWFADLSMRSLVIMHQARTSSIDSSHVPIAMLITTPTIIDLTLDYTLVDLGVSAML